MTKFQKQVIEYLAKGGDIAVVGTGRYRVRINAVPLMTITTKTLDKIKEHCKKEGQVLVLNKKKILSYNKRNTVKKIYKRVRDAQPESTETPAEE